MKRVALLLSSPAVFLAACSDEAAPDGNGAGAQEGEVTGEILPGSISDDMLPLDQLASQSPSVRDDPEGAAASPTSEGPSSVPSSGSGADAASEDEPEVPSEPSAPQSFPAIEPAPAPPPPPTGTAPTVAPPADDGQ